MGRTAVTITFAAALVLATTPSALASRAAPARSAESPLIAVISETAKSANLLVKEGSPSAPWNLEYKHVDSHQAAVATDSRHGPLIAVITDSDDVLVKEGSLTASWNHEYNGGNAEYVAVASDPKNGPLIVVMTFQGKVLAKEGSLTARWVTEYSRGALHIAAASDSKHGPLIGRRVRRRGRELGGARSRSRLRCSVRGRSALKRYL